MRAGIQKLVESRWLCLLSLIVPMHCVYAALEVGKPAPNFKAETLAGAELELKQFKGRYVVLEWLNPWCDFVTKHYSSGSVPALQQTFTNRDVVWIVIGARITEHSKPIGEKQLNDYLRNNGAHPTHVLIDQSGHIGSLYDAKTTPHMYVIDPQGTLAYQGAIDSIVSTSKEDIRFAQNYVESALIQLPRDIELRKPVTRPYGCSIQLEGR